MNPNMKSMFNNVICYKVIKGKIDTNLQTKIDVNLSIVKIETTKEDTKLIIIIFRIISQPIIIIMKKIKITLQESLIIININKICKIQQ